MPSVKCAVRASPATRSSRASLPQGAQRSGWPGAWGAVSSRRHREGHRQPAACVSASQQHVCRGVTALLAGVPHLQYGCNFFKPRHGDRVPAVEDHHRAGVFCAPPAWMRRILPFLQEERGAGALVPGKQPAARPLSPPAPPLLPAAPRGAKALTSAGGPPQARGRRWWP